MSSALTTNKVKSNISRIIFECWHTGHRIEYVGHLIKYVAKDELLKSSTVFVLGSELKKKLEINRYPIEGVQLYILQEEFDDFKVSRIRVLKKIKHLVSDYRNTSEIILLNYDFFQYSLFFINIPKHVAVKAIWFRPFIHLKTDTLKGKALLFLKKYILRSSIKLNSNLKKIFILNERNGVDSLNQSFFDDSSVPKFFFLPDPIDLSYMAPASQDELRIQFNFGLDEKIFLIIGSIDAKKNIENILAALLRIKDTTNTNIRLIIAGRISANYSRQFDQSIKSFESQKASSVSLTLINEFLSVDKFNFLIKLSDFMVMIYKDFYSSSGILGYSVKYRKIVLTTDKGLANSLTKEYQLGLRCDDSSIDEIAKSFSLALELNRNTIDPKYDKFLDDFSVERFSNILLQ